MLFLGALWKLFFTLFYDFCFIPVSSGICGIPALFELLDLDDFLLAPRFVALGSLAALPPAAPLAFGGTALLLAFFLDFDL